MEILNKKERLERIEYMIWDLKVLADGEDLNLGIDYDGAVNRTLRAIKKVENDYRIEVSE